MNQGDLPRALADGITAATAQTVVRPLRDGDEAAWEAYVARHPDATFFHRAGWRRVIADVMGHRTHYRVAERASQFVGVLPLVEISSALFGRALTSLPFAVYGGALGDDAGIVHALDADALQLARERGVQHLELRNRTPAHPDWPRQDLHVTFRRQIFPEVEANLLAIPRKQRAMVRKAMARNLSGEIEERVDTFFDLYADNQHRHGTPPLPRRWFDALRAEFGSACEILTVRSPAGEAVSAVMSFYFRDEVLPYYAGDRPAARDLAANDFKYWDLMRRACERGLRTFDYGRSKRGTGSFDFKKNWGFEPQPLAYEFALLRRAEIPQHNPANPKYRALIAAWKRMPRGLSDALGPFIVRNLG